MGESKGASPAGGAPFCRRDPTIIFKCAFETSKFAFEIVFNDVWEYQRMIKTRYGKKLSDWFGKAEQFGISLTDAGE